MHSVGLFHSDLFVVKLKWCSHDIVASKSNLVGLTCKTIIIFILFIVTLTSSYCPTPYTLFLLLLLLLILNKCTSVWAHYCRWLPGAVIIGAQHSTDWFVSQSYGVSTYLWHLSRWQIANSSVLTDHQSRVHCVLLFLQCAEYLLIN